MPDEIRDLLSFGQQIMKRAACSEKDIVHHLLAPLLVAVGWERMEIYFERGQGRSKPDIALIPRGVTKPILTVEAKAPNKKMILYPEGWSCPMDIRDIGKKRDDPAHQVFRQFVTNERLNDQPYAFLSNGNIFSLFTVVRETEHRYNMRCLYSTTISKILKDDVTVSGFQQFLSRNTYCENNCVFLVARLRDLPANTISTGGTSNSSGQSLESPKAIELPYNWYEMFQDWAKSFEASAREPDAGFQHFKLICDPQLLPLERMSFFEVMRFCHMLSPKLPKGWRLVFERGQKGRPNINIKLCPNWLPTKLRGSPLFQITPNGKSPGIIWFDASESKLQKQQEGTPCWHFHRMKIDMKSKLPDKLCIYEEGMVERLISLLDEFADRFIAVGLVSEALLPTPQQSRLG